jgi:uncharacterized protein (DUF952 family)
MKGRAMKAIYHIAYKDDWEKALAAGVYAMSTKGRTLDQQGFVHASDAHQVALVANAIYQAGEDVLVLVIDSDRLVPPVRYEREPDADSAFPHIYGAINVDAVVRVRLLERGPDGRFTFEAGDEGSSSRQGWA